MDCIKFVAPIPSELYDRVIIHLRNNFFADEPLNKSVGLCKPGEPHAELEEHSISTLQDGLSVAAVDKVTDEIAGVALNGVLRPGDLEKGQEKLDCSNDEGFKQIFSMLYNVSHSLDLFTAYETDKIFETRILSVDSRYRGIGLGNELIKRVDDVARENGFKILKGDATGSFSQKICSKNGYEIIHELKYSDYKSENGEPIFKPLPPHNSLKIMVKILK